MSMDFPGFFSSLIIKINYPHLSGGLKGSPSPPQELEVGGRRPLYLLVFYICLRLLTILCHVLCLEMSELFWTKSTILSSGQVRYLYLCEFEYINSSSSVIRSDSCLRKQHHLNNRKLKINIGGYRKYQRGS